MSGPTTLQVAAWEAVQRHGGLTTFGSRSRAARDLGLASQAVLQSRLVGYARNTGAVLPPAAPPPEHPHLSRRERRLLVELAAADRRIDELKDWVDAVGPRLERIEAILQRLLERPSAAVDHRRIADGGHRAKAQRRGRPAA